MQSIRQAIIRAFAEHRTFLVVGHQDLDGDCIGCQLALHHWLGSKGKEVIVVSNGPTFRNYEFVPGFAAVHRSMPNPCSVDATICVDTASAERILDGIRPQGLVINIDHHIGNTNYGDINWIEPRAAAVGEMIYTLIKHAREPLTPEIARCLYVAIMTDTGSFRHSYTTARTFEIAAGLVRAGAGPFDLSNAYHNQVHPDTVRMAAEVMSRLHYEVHGKLVWGEFTREIYREPGGLERQPEQLSSQMRSIKGVEVALLFHELEDGGRASFRSRGHVSVAAMAAEVGGGGHVAAAGCRFDGDYKSGRDRILAAARRHMIEPFTPGSDVNISEFA